MKTSKVVALSAITTAFCILLLTFGAYVEVFDLSCLFMASLALMLPLTKGYKLGGFLSYLASVILGFILTGARFQILIPFTMFFGLHPLANYLQKQYKINAFLATVIKTVWFVATLFITYYFTKMFIVEHETVEKYINWIILIGGSVVFLIYDRLMYAFQRSLEKIISRLKL